MVVIKPYVFQLTTAVATSVSVGALVVAAVEAAAIATVVVSRNSSNMLSSNGYKVQNIF